MSSPPRRRASCLMPHASLLITHYSSLIPSCGVNGFILFTSKMMDSVSRNIYRAWQITAVALAAIVSVWTLATHPLSSIALAGFFAALILCAAFLRIDADEASIGFEAPIVFGAIIIFHDPTLPLVATFVGLGLHALRSRRFEAVAGAAQSSLAYA